MKLVRSMVWVAFAGSMALGAVAQQTGWVVKPEWVRAHEEFLASDVMQGRGSATRDEEITATYVASEFMAYGLKMAPGMSGYLQSAEISGPQLDGHAALTVSGVTLAEGQDFALVLAPGAVNLTAPLRVVKATDVAAAKDLKGAVVLVTDVPAGKVSMQAFQGLRRAGAAAIVLPEDESTTQMMTLGGGKTRVPIRLKETANEYLRGSSLLLAVTKGAAAKLATSKDGESVSMMARELPGVAERHTYNAIGYLEGSDPKAGTILLTAHLDHLGVGRAVNGDAIYNGANDDAAGTTAVLELAHALAAGPKLKRSVLFVCYGSEEAGELGSTYFGKHSPVPLQDLVTNLEFEMIGNQDPKMPKGVLLLTGWERSNLGPTLKAHGALLGPDPYPEEHFFERSDNYALALQGVVAHTAAGWGTPPTYHQPSDDLAHLDVPFMTSAVQSLVEPVRWLADSDFKPEWVAGGRPRGRE